MSRSGSHRAPAVAERGPSSVFGQQTLRAPGLELRKTLTVEPADTDVDGDPAPERSVFASVLSPLVRALLISDLAAIALVLMLARTNEPSVVTVGLIAMVLFTGAGLYRQRLSLSLLDDLPAIVGRTLVAGAVVASLALISGDAGSIELIAVSAALVLLFSAFRGVAYAVVRQARRSGRVAHSTLVLGGGQLACDLMSTLQDHPEYGLRPVGFLDDLPLLPHTDHPVPCLGGYASLVTNLRKLEVRNVVIAFGSLPESRVVDIVRTCDRLSCEIFYVPRLFELEGRGPGIEDVWGIPLVRLRRAAFRTVGWMIKRIVDVAVSALLLVVLSPLMLLIALASKIETGQVIFGQERVGLDGVPIRVLKFCSLAPADPGEAASAWNVANDERIGRVGRIIRATSLDELPQLWN
ncbi:MAG: sugar transferase, partial [Actinomycetes bacterium]